jgi:hypothetical protein
MPFGVSIATQDVHEPLLCFVHAMGEASCAPSSNARNSLRWLVTRVRYTQFPASQIESDAADSAYRSAFARCASFGETAFAPLRLPSAAGAKRPSRSFAEGEAKAGWLFGTISATGLSRMRRPAVHLLCASSGSLSERSIPALTRTRIAWRLVDFGGMRLGLLITRTHGFGADSIASLMAQ